ncbi:hypothetical protein DXN04_00545 [Chitinophaga silvisoli]|uniref:Tail specific protease domain-containing protein n=2 Tax=Chitinophaga silvisoli TaxID=2291814 RepID=A0A3E1P7M3_9BACT|nr:hypothetical protein DXN04_00545 [Chitinophaga silvisoli]
MTHHPTCISTIIPLFYSHTQRTLPTYNTFYQTMKNLIIPHLAFISAFLLITPNLKAQTETCNCLDNLNKTIHETELNYAGYPAKVNTNYKKLVSNLQSKAATLTAPKQCYYLIREYVRFFKDKHFIISYTNPRDFDSTILSYSRKTVLPIEGIWISPDSTTKIAIQKSANGTFNAIKYESSTDSFPKGFVYFTLTPKGNEYFVKKYDAFVSTDFPAKQTGNLLHIWNHTVWGKVFPQQMTKAENEELSTWRNNNNGLAFKKINSEISYLKIPSFYNNDSRIQQLVAASDSTIRNTRYLIVDLRDNGGGNTGWVYFLPYLMTNPIIQQPALIRVTPDNIKRKLPELEYFVKNPIEAEYKKYFPEQVLNAYKKAYAELPTTKENFYPIPAVTFPLDSITKQPEKVAVIVNNFCGSSTEYFISLTDQCKKVITYGSNTIGMMDYEGMSNPTPLPYEKFILTIPITKSNWTDTKPIDQTGFAPDVPIKLPENRWIEFVVDDLPKR